VALPDFHAELTRRREAGLLRETRSLTPLSATTVAHCDRVLTVFCSNDYLGLAGDPRLGEALASPAVAGSGAAHLISGHRPEHEQLEAALCEFLERDSALFFSTGYMANVGVIDALAGRGDTVVQDRLNHASLIDGGRMSGARLRRYAHASVERAAAVVNAASGGTLLATDGVFSMDGDTAPLAGLAQVAADAGATLMVDDAHGIGVEGPDGRGSVAAAGLGQSQVPVLVGTLGKAFGVFGAFVAGPAALVDYLKQTARTWIYTTAPPPGIAAACALAVDLAHREGWRREHLADLVGRFREGASRRGIPLMSSSGPIQPVPVGEARRALAVSRALEDRGYLVTAIRPPTVPRGTARLRVTLSAAHRRDQVDGLLEALERVL